MSIRKIAFTCCLIFVNILYAQSQFDLGHYERKDKKVYFICELGLGVSDIRKTTYESSVASPNGYTRGFYAFYTYTNLGVMFNVHPKWSIGAFGNIGVNVGEISDGSWLGLRGRVSRHFAHDIEWNISPGIRARHIGEINGFDIESTVSWRDHIGIFARFEKETHSQINFYDKTEIYSLGLFTKGKKGFWSTVGTTAGAILFTVVLLASLGG